MIDQAAYLLELDKLRLPMVNYHQTVNFGLSVVNFFALAMGLFMMAVPMMGWIDYESPSLGTAFMFGGICEYLIGFYDWYQGRTMLSFIDFMYGLLHLVFYYTADLGKYSIWVPTEYYTYMQGVFYVLWLIILLFVILSTKTRGCIYTINMLLLALATIFVIIWEFSKRTWARKAAGYILFFASILLWYTGLGRLFKNVFYSDCAPLVNPYW